MTSPSEISFNALTEHAYTTAIAYHGDLGLESEAYANQLLCIARKHLRARLSSEAAVGFITRLYTNDLYLSFACARPTNRAWERFIALYRIFINRTASVACSSADTASEVADSVPGHLFLPDRFGRSRIASFEGRSSLATWLTVVVTNKAIREQQRSNNLEQLESWPDIAACDAIEGIEAAYRAGKCWRMVQESLRAATSSLSERERFIFALRHEDGLHGNEIARILGLHPSAITRCLHHVYAKLRAGAVSDLTHRCGFSAPLIEECLRDICEDSDYSMQSLLSVGQ